jgi:hypothetical protein
VRRIAAAAGVLLLLLVVGQLTLPLIAEKVVRGMLDDRGKVESVDVKAFPAFKLIWRHADKVTVHMSSLTLGTGDIGQQLEDSRGAGEVDAVVDDATLGPLHLRNLEFHKDAAALSGEASVTTQDLKDALLGISVVPVASGDGALVMEATVGPVSARARLSASDGALQIAPDGLLGGFASLTVFEDPRVVVDGVGARSGTNGFTLTAAGRLP